MTIKPIGVIRLHDNMNLNEIKQVENKISVLKGNEKIRSRITNLGKNKVTIFEVYKNTFSERSLHKLEKLKNIFINKKLSENSCLTKSILGKNSISVEEVKIFIKGKNAAIQKTLDDEIKKLEDEFGLKDITIENLRNDEEIKDIKQQKNPNEISIEILDDQPILMDIEDEDEYKFISHPAVEITTSDIVPPPPTDDIGPPPPTDDIGPPPPTDDPGPPPPTDDIGPPPPTDGPGPPPTKVDPDLVERRKLLNLLKDMGLR